MEKLVLVTGAGASRDFCPEFGVGLDLLDAIYSYISEDGSYLNNVINHLIEQEGIKENNQKKRDYLLEKGKHFQSIRIEFSNDLKLYLSLNKKNSEPVSIDHFIHENSRYKELASFCIAVFIAGYEGASFKNFNYNEHWLFRLCNLLEYGIDNKLAIEFEIVTFNYDRLIEAYIHWYFSNRVKYCTKIQDFLRTRVHHVYGKIGNLPFVEGHGLLYGIHNSRSEFMQESTAKFELMFHHANQQDNRDTILTEGRNDEFLKGIVKSGSEVWIMGFGFDSDNVNKLGLEGTPNVYSSVFRIEELANVAQFVNECNILRGSCSEFFNYRIAKSTLGLPKLSQVSPWGPY